MLVTVPGMSSRGWMRVRRDEGTYFFTTVLVLMNRLTWIRACFSNMSYSCEATRQSQHAHTTATKAKEKGAADVAFVLGELDGDELDVLREELQDRLPVLPHNITSSVSVLASARHVMVGGTYDRRVLSPAHNQGHEHRLRAFA